MYLERISSLYRYAPDHINTYRQVVHGMGSRAASRINVGLLMQRSSRVVIDVAPGMGAKVLLAPRPVVV